MAVGFIGGIKEPGRVPRFLLFIEKTRYKCRSSVVMIKNKSPIVETNALTTGLFVERMTGIEPAYSAWEADVLPLNYIRDCKLLYNT